MSSVITLFESQFADCAEFFNCLVLETGNIFIVHLIKKQHSYRPTPVFHILHFYIISTGL